MATPDEPLAQSFTASDGYVASYLRYDPPSSVKSEVVYVHGIQSHSGWYGHSCSRLRRAGHRVWFLDRRGSGPNREARGDAPSFRRLLDDLAEFIREVRGASATLPPSPALQKGGRPLFLLAVSWGGKLAAALQRRHPGLADGLALLCPGFCPKVRPPLRQRLKILAARLTNPTRRFPIPLNDPELFTANLARQQFLRDDKLSLHEATARFLVESVRLDAYLRWVPRHVAVPTLLMLAGLDRIIDNARTRAYVNRFAAPDTTILEYPAAHHTLEFEQDPEPFLADLTAWLDRWTTSAARTVSDRT